MRMALARIATIGVAAVVALSTSIVGTTMPAEALSAAQIRTAQTRLNYLGCNAGPVDGSVGSDDPGRHGQVPGGDEDRADRHAGRPDVLAAGCLLAQALRQRQVLLTSGGGRRIVLSQSQNWLWVIDSSGRVVAQGGMIDNPSVYGPGIYYTGPKCGKPARVKNNTDWRQPDPAQLRPVRAVRRRVPPDPRRTSRPVRRSTRTTCSARTTASRTAASGCPERCPDVIWNFAAVSTRVVIVR